MTYKKGTDKKGEFYRLGLIERLALTLDNYASSDWGRRFYSDEFLSGLCARRNEIHANVSKASGGVVISTILLAFLDNVVGTVTFWGIEVAVPKLASLSLSVVVMLNISVLVMKLLDQLIIDRLVHTLGSRIGAYQFELALLNYSAQNLYSSALLPKYFGLTSQSGHKFSSGLNLFLMTLGGVALVSFPVAVVGNAVISNILDGVEMVEVALISVALFFFFQAIILLLSFMVGYKFRPATLSEPSNPYVPEDFIELGHPIGPTEDIDRKNPDAE